MSDAKFAVFLNGTYGAGKSSALDHIGDLLADAGTPFSLMDVDWFFVSGVMATSSDRERYEKALGLPVRSARLTADADELEARLRRRYSEGQHRSLTWHLDRHARLTQQLIEADLDEFVIDTTKRTQELDHQPCSTGTQNSPLR